MAGLRELQGQIGSVQNTAKLTNAMKMVAAVRLGRLEERTRTGGAYHDAFEGLFRRLMAIVGGIDHQLAKPPVGGSHLFVLISGDRGLCGPYNANIVSLLESRVSEEGFGPDDYEVGTVGRKGRSMAGYRELILGDLAVEGLPIDLPVAAVRELASKLSAGYLAGRWRAVEILYTKYGGQARLTPTSMPLLPFALPEGGEDAGDEDVIYEPDAQTIVERLIPMALQGLVFRSLQEAFTSEQSARMLAMTQATDNAKEVIKEKRKLFNKLRQEAITAELMDIIGGAAAVD